MICDFFDLQTGTIALFVDIRRAAWLSIGMVALLNSSCSRNLPRDSADEGSYPPATNTPNAELKRVEPNVKGKVASVAGRPAASSQSQKVATATEPAVSSERMDEVLEVGTNAQQRPVGQNVDRNDAKNVLASALKAQRSARSAADNGQFDSAYTESLSAWQSLQEQADDDACQMLAAEMLKELEVYGEKLSDAAKHRPTGNVIKKPIRFE